MFFANPNTSSGALAQLALATWFAAFVRP